MLERFGWRRRDETAGEAAGVSALVRAGDRVELRTHVPANKAAFQRWYADAEIAELLRHDLVPLSDSQSSSYFDSLILPMSDKGQCFAIHERESGRLLGTTALTDFSRRTTGRSTCLFRIVIGEKDTWNQGYGTEATALVVEEAFERLDLSEVRLEVFRHNTRAQAAYRRVGFTIVGEHTEWVGRQRRELHVIEMRLRRIDWEAARPQSIASMPADSTPALNVEDDIAVDPSDGETAAERGARLERRRSRRRTRGGVDGNGTTPIEDLSGPNLAPEPMRGNGLPA